MVTGIPHQPIGQILRSRGLIDAEQIEAILQAQVENGRPFGELAETMFGVDPNEVALAWQQQYLAHQTQIDLEDQTIDPSVVGMIDRRRAWQFGLVPLRREDDQLVVATTAQRLRRSVVFAWRYFAEPVFVVVCETQQMNRHLETHYPWAIHHG